MNTGEIQVGQNVEQQATVGGNVEQQPIYVPNPEVREMMEHKVQIAWERERSGQPLRMQDKAAIDYYNVVLRHLPQPIKGPNKPVFPHLQQSDYDAQNEPLWLQRLTNRWIRRVEAMMTNIEVERFEFVDNIPENEESCRICLENFATGEEIRRLDCAHRFHITCTQEWFLIKNACPLCNRRGMHLI